MRLTHWRARLCDELHGHFTVPTFLTFLFNDRGHRPWLRSGHPSPPSRHCQPSTHARPCARHTARSHLIAHHETLVAPIQPSTTVCTTHFARSQRIIHAHPWSVPPTAGSIANSPLPVYHPMGTQAFAAMGTGANSAAVRAATAATAASGRRPPAPPSALVGRHLAKPRVQPQRLLHQANSILPLHQGPPSHVQPRLPCPLT